MTIKTQKVNGRNRGKTEGNTEVKSKSAPKSKVSTVNGRTTYPVHTNQGVILRDEAKITAIDSDFSAKEVKAWQFHALWLFLRSVSNPQTDDLLASEIFPATSHQDLSKLVEFGRSFGLIAMETNDIHATPLGKTFANLPHWRIWVPPTKLAEVLAKYGKLHWFLTAKILESRPKIIDLFSGAGGLGLGFESAGFQVVAAIDNDPQAAAAHKVNFPECAMIQEDITKLAKDPIKYFCRNLGIEPRKIAGVVGGPPCQGFSYIGERQVSDERNLLTSRFMDIVLGIEPDFFVLENVPGLLNSGSKPTLANYFKQLCKSIGTPASHIVDALPPIPRTVHKRDRQFRKRLVSGVVTEFGASVGESLKDKLSLDAMKVVVEPLTALLKKKLLQKTEQIYGELGNQVAAQAVENCGIQIGLISITTIVTQVLGSKRFKACAPRIVLDAILPCADQKTRSHMANLLTEHENAPDDVVYKGVLIGPILYHLIQRASEHYDIAAPQVLNSAHFGSPQARRRAFLVGIHKRKKISFQFPKPSFDIPNDPKARRVGADKSAPTCGEALGDLPDVDLFPDLLNSDKLPIGKLGRPVSDFASGLRLETIPYGDMSLPRPTWKPFEVDCCKRTIHEEKVLMRLNSLEEGAFDEGSHKTRLDRDRVSHTIRAGTRENKGSHTAVRPVHYEYPRVITVREGARLMGFPDWMTFHETKWHGFRLVGNGVPSAMGKSVAEQIKSLLFQE